MTSRTNKESAIGFISALQYEGAWLGGLLLTDSRGKPIEFHCTAPVKVSHSHQILFGPTIDSFVLADNVAPKLMAAVKTEPSIVCTDLIEMTAADAGNGGVVLVVGLEPSPATNPPVCGPKIHRVFDEGNSGQSNDRNDEGPGEQLNDQISLEQEQENHCIGSASSERQLRRLDSLDQFAIGEQKFAIEKGAESRRNEMIAQLRQFANEIDLTEPFERIQNAIQQSHGIKSSQEAA